MKKHFTKKSADDINELISNAKLTSADPKIIDCKALLESEQRSEFKNALWRQRLREHETFITRITSVLHDARHDLTAKFVVLLLNTKQRVIFSQGAEDTVQRKWGRGTK